jgi:endo-1,4-beta-xylanase
MAADLTRRSILAAAMAAPLLASPLRADESLGSLAARRGIAFGSALDLEILEDQAYARLIAAECRIGAVENSLKFDWLRGRGPDASFVQADRLVARIAELGLAVKGTALIWNDWAPDWLKRESREAVPAIMDRHIDETVGRYAGRIAYWDVVNEPFYPPLGEPGGFRTGAWYDALGPGYVARAFRRAARADPKALLVLNEAFTEQEDELGLATRTSLLALVDRLLDEGVPVGMIGLQGHLKPGLPFNDAGFAAFLWELSARGLPLAITELDVDDSGFPDDAVLRDTAVAARLEAFLAAVLPVPGLTQVIAWQLSDRYSWYRHAQWHREQVAARGGDPDRGPRTQLFDEAMAPKPAREALAKALASG